MQIILQPADSFVLCRIAVAAVLDCLWPAAMKWYFDTPRLTKFLRVRITTSANNNSSSPAMKTSLFRIVSTIVVIVYLLTQAIDHKDVQFMYTLQNISGGLGVM